MNNSYPQKPAPVGTEKYEAFDLVTEALAHLADYNRRGKNDDSLLEKADHSLTNALKIDGDYFKAKYLQAMVRYLRGQQEDKGNRKGAINLFGDLLKEANAEPLAREICYNLAAAYSERNEPDSWQSAITYFNEAINRNEKSSTSFDPELDLLARAGLVKTHLARQKAAEKIDNTGKPDKKDAEQVEIDSIEIKKHSDKIQKVLRPGFTRRLPRLLLLQKSINWNVANKVEEVVDVAEGRKRRKPRAEPRELTVRVKAVLLWAAIILGTLAVILVLLSIVVSVYLYGAVRRPL